MNHLERATAIVLVFVVAINIYSVMQPRDSTDSGSTRSGLGLHVDAKTGCHYLSTARGGITPRYDRNGTHICTGPEKEP